MAASAARTSAVNLLDHLHQAGLQSLLSKLYAKPVELNIIKIRRPHLDADILASVVTQKLRDRKASPRRVIRDAAWKAQLPTDRSVVELQQAKKQPGTMVTSRALERSSAFGPLRTETAKIIQSLKLSQVSSVRVEAAGRLSKRITANRSQRKVARRGANAKSAGYMVRGFRKAHMAETKRASTKPVESWSSAFGRRGLEVALPSFIRAFSERITASSEGMMEEESGGGVIFGSSANAKTELELPKQLTWFHRQLYTLHHLHSSPSTSPPTVRPRLIAIREPLFITHARLRTPRSMSDLQELFARLKAQASESQPPPPPAQPSIWANAQQQNYQAPAVSSPLFSPPIQQPTPMQNLNMPASNASTPVPEQARTNNLLNLLKFNNQSSQANAQPGPMANLQNVGGARSGSFNTFSGGQGAASARPLSAQDLMASLQRKPSAPGALPSPLAGAGAEKMHTPAPSSGNQQDFLLNLLKRPNAQTPVQSIETESGTAPEPHRSDSNVDKLAQSLGDASFNPVSSATSGVEREPTPVRQFGTAASRESTPFAAPKPAMPTKFNYVNPFDELHSSSPLNRTPNPETQAERKKIEILKHDRDASGLNGHGAGPAAKSRKLDAPSQPRSVTPEPESKNQSVAEAVQGVGEKVDKQVEQALAAAETKTKPSKGAAAATGDNAADDEPVIKKEPGGDDEVESSWESAEDSANEKKHASVVTVYNFPMKPFVTINIKSVEPAMPIRQDNFMVVAQLKKDFDQMDRSLVTASQTHIVYAQTGTKRDNSGFRIIRQDTGDHKQVFRFSGERVFSVQLCSSVVAGHDVESVLGTGVNGSVFWTSLAKSRPELFVDDDVEGQGFIMPAVATPDENTSNSQVKTRAKCSVRHPEFFAMSRSKMIHIISPETVKDRAYTSASSRKVDSAKYLAEHGLRINTNKANKDFAFSEDDSVIVSLDKSGVVKFWDIRELTARAGDSTEGPHDPVELKEPMWTLAAVASGSKPDEKPSVSSIMLLDKERPHSKGLALRYMLVGFKQNHILQLWDLGLGKAVQELRLPHGKDSDGICSITYHPKTGILAVGHPTRNSLYFVHVSAPKYNISPSDQARYINMLARQDSALPKPESTAIMSGLREFTLDKAGQLRSMDMLKTPVDNASEKGTAEETLFEIYAMHSKGVFGMPVKRTDLGWDAQNKMMNPKNAVDEGVVEVIDLVLPQAGAAPSETSSVVEPPAKKTEKVQIKKREVAKPEPEAKSATVSAASPTASSAPTTNGGSRTQTSPSKGSKQVPEAPVPSQRDAVNPPIITAASYAMADQRVTSPPRERAVGEASIAANNVAKSPKVEAASSAAPPMGADVQAALAKQFASLYQRLDADKRVTEASGAARQDAMLRLVSSTLTENVEQSLSGIIGASIEQEVIPAFTENTNKVIDRKLAELLPQQISTSVQREIKAALPSALAQAFRDQQVQRTISDMTANQVAQKVQQQVSMMLQQSLPNMAVQATQKMVADLEARTTQRLREADTQRQQDNAKIDQLSGFVRSLSTTIQNMADSQAAFQEQISQMQQSRSNHFASSSETKSSETVEEPVAVVDPQQAAEEEEVSRITQSLMAGEYEDATIQWLQSANQATLFDRLFVRVNPQYLLQVTPLVALSVSAAITASFESNIDARLEWLSAVLSQINMKDHDIMDVAPKIMDVLSQRLQGAYMLISETNPGDHNLGRISALVRQVREVRRLTA
ncbi:hypothetical protein LTR08_000998 [Meristemomyces frigidus]|nr:hypothetical protein LTR08_000998 [Meristemomyces frigidus]